MKSAMTTKGTRATGSWLLGATLLFSVGTTNAQPGMMMDMDEYGMRGWGMMQGPMGMCRGMMDDDMMGMMGPMGLMGFGPHMMGSLWGLDLSKEQRDKIRQIMREQRSKHFDMAEQRMAIWDELEEAHDQDKPDPKKTAAIYGKLFALKQQMIEQSIETQNKIRDLLTEEQREKLSSGYPGVYSRGMGPHGMMK